MGSQVPRDPAWCIDCVGCIVEDVLVPPRKPCQYHRDPGDPSKARPYEGPDVYKPSEFVLETVGQNFRGWDGDVYSCFGYDPRCGFWMRSSTRVANLSERAIGRTYHKVHKKEPLP